MTPEWVTLKEAAEYLRVSPATLRRAVHHNRCRVAILGSCRAWRFRRQWLDDLAETSATPNETRGFPRVHSAA
jgi:excisionase family DNA binding protein